MIAFHVRFERIHPFQDGNGRVGRLILFKECLKYGIVPFIIEDDLKLFYYRGLKEWGHENGYLTDTFLTAQDRFKKYLDYFRIGINFFFEYCDAISAVLWGRMAFYIQLNRTELLLKYRMQSHTNPKRQRRRLK